MMFLASLEVAAWMYFRYPNIARAARIPTIATTAISSKIVKPRRRRADGSMPVIFHEREPGSKRGQVEPCQRHAM